MSAVVTVREFALADLDAAGRFCEAARTLDPAVEPFAQRLGLIATGERAPLDLWRVATDEGGEVRGIAFAALRESSDRPVHDLYCAVHPALRRQGMGRALCEPALATQATLRVRVRDDAGPGLAFLRALGFRETSAQLSLQRQGVGLEQPPMPALRIRSAAARDAKVLQRLSNEAWAGAPDAFLSRPDEIAQLFAEEGRLVLLAESEGRPMGYLSAVPLGRTLGIEEVAVLPEFRRMGIGRALLVHAFRGASAAVLSVSESNQPARALYRSLGFRQVARRLVFERTLR